MSLKDSLKSAQTRVESIQNAANQERELMSDNMFSQRNGEFEESHYGNGFRFAHTGIN